MNTENKITDAKIKEDEISALNTPLSIDASKVPNPVLQRLIEEIQDESQNNVTAYNRLHNRHNRTR